MEALGLLAIASGFNFMSGLVFFVICISLICLKYYVVGMDKQNLHNFLNSISINQYLIAMALLILVSILLTWLLIYHVLKFFSYENATLWSFIMFLATAISTCINFYNKKDAISDVVSSLYTKFQN
ncbi:MAG: hypothetical protein R3Y29_08600 [bacterium]